MTTAIFKQDGNSFEVTVSGHAGYNPGGPDIVCSACSALAYTLLQVMLAEEDRGGLVELHAHEPVDGNFRVTARTTERTRARMEVIFDVIESGFALLQAKYPEHVKCRPEPGRHDFSHRVRLF